MSLTSMRKGCPGHIQRKVHRFGWCSCSLYRGPPRPRGRRSRGLIWSALGGYRRGKRRHGLKWWRGVQKPLAAGQGKTVPGVVPLAAVGRSAPCGPPWRPAGENPGSRRRWVGGPNPGRHNGVHAGWLPCPPYRRCASGSGLKGVWHEIFDFRFF